MNFDELTQQLSAAGCSVPLSDCHGFLCGYLCTRDHIAEDVVRDCLLADTRDQGPADICLATIMTLVQDVQVQIKSPDFTLELMLPDESSSLQERGISFIHWCEGFLGGLGASGTLVSRSLSAEARELLEDMYQICRLDPLDLAEAEPAEEYSLLELIEYVRMGALLIAEELGADAVALAPQPVLH